MNLEKEFTNKKDTPQKIALAAEEITVAKKVEKEKRTFRKEVIEENVVIPTNLLQEDIEIQKVPINREVTEIPTVRTEGDVTIIPILKEEVVIVKKKILVEEIHIKKKYSNITHDIEEVIRKEIFKEESK